MAGKQHKITPKQERFCWKYIETGNAHAAYIFAYDVDWRSKSEDWTYTEASKLLNNHKITHRLNEIKAQLSQSSFINLEQILLELEQARMVALTKKDVQGMVKATATKAKILGLGPLEKLKQQMEKLEDD